MQLCLIKFNYFCGLLQRFLTKTCFTSLRQFSRGSINNSSSHGTVENNEDSLPEEQDVPHQIYNGMLTKQVRAVKTFSLGTSLIGLGMQPVLYEVRLIFKFLG